MKVQAQNTFNDVDGLFGDLGGIGASPDGLGMTVRSFGDDAQVIAAEPSPARKALMVAYALAGVAGAAIGAYHGYKRNDSVGWAIGWSILGSLFPVVVIPVAYAQGIGERKRGR